MSDSPHRNADLEPEPFRCRRPESLMGTVLHLADADIPEKYSVLSPMLGLPDTWEPDRHKLNGIELSPPRVLTELACSGSIELHYCRRVTPTDMLDIPLAEDDDRRIYEHALATIPATELSSYSQYLGLRLVPKGPQPDSGVLVERIAWWCEAAPRGVELVVEDGFEANWREFWTVQTAYY